MPETDAPVLLRNDELLIRRDAAFLQIDPDGALSLIEDGVNVRVDADGTVYVLAVVVAPSEWIDPAGWITVSVREVGSLIVRRPLAGRAEVVSGLAGMLRAS